MKFGSWTYDGFMVSKLDISNILYIQFFIYIFLWDTVKLMADKVTGLVVIKQERKHKNRYIVIGQYTVGR